MSLLEATGLTLAFGGLKAISEFSLSLDKGDLQGLIGPNGAGKTTAFNLLTGVYRPDAGRIVLDGEDVIGKKPSRIAAAGIARTFQNIRLFGELSVLDNVRIAGHVRTTKSGLFRTVLATPDQLREEEELTDHARSLLRIFHLLEREEEQARNLPYGAQRRLEIARAIATRPKVLLLDEPAAGMNPQEKHELEELIDLARKQFGLTVLLIEHDMGLVMDICEKITVLDHGVTIARGTPKEIQSDPKVIEAYLGAPSTTVLEPAPTGGPR